MRSDTPFYSNPLYGLLLDEHRHLYKELESHSLGDRNHLAVDLVDSAGRIALSSSTRELANSAAVAETFSSHFGELEPGSAVLTNDPYAGSQHLQDHWVGSPVYEDGRYLGMVLVHAHLADVGGRTLGNYFPEARDVWQEGVRTTPVRLCRDGRPQRDVLETIKLNSRLPHLLERDLRAMVATSERAASELVPILKSNLAWLQDLASEQISKGMPVAARSAEAVTFELHNCSAPEVSISLGVSVGPDGVVADFSGSSSQTDKGFLNSTLTNTRSAVADVLANRLNAVPNSDVLQMVDVRAESSSIVDCDFPKPVGWSPYQPREGIAKSLRSKLSELEFGEEYYVYKVERRPAVHIMRCEGAACPF